LIFERRIVMPNYRNGERENNRKPMREEQERKRYEPEWDGDEEDMGEDRKFVKNPKPCKLFFPFMVEVRVIPFDDHKSSQHCDEHKRPQYR
jgi:hypothetical protein